MTLLEVSELSVAYGAIEAVRNVSFVVGEGQIVCLIGANGAGKSTTLRTISGLLRPRAGDIRFEGRSIIKDPAHGILSRGIAHSPEGRRVFARMSVEENLLLGAYTRKDESGVQADMRRVYELFPVLGQRSHQKAGLFSGGEQQMLAIARALMAEPKLLMLDEPTEGLAPVVIDELVLALREIRQRGTALLLVEQHVGIIRQLADSFLALRKGELVGSGPVAELESRAVQELIAL